MNLKPKTEEEILDELRNSPAKEVLQKRENLSGVLLSLMMNIATIEALLREDKFPFIVQALTAEGAEEDVEVSRKDALESLEIMRVRASEIKYNLELMSKLFTQK